MTSSADFEKALQVGRPPNVVKRFPNSRALIVSGKYIDRAMIAKGKSMLFIPAGLFYRCTAPSNPHGQYILYICTSACPSLPVGWSR